MDHIIALVDTWREESTALRNRYGAEGIAHTIERLADDLEDAIREAEDDLLTLTQASHISGYSVDHLGRMVREGKIPNAGRKGSPRIRNGDLPANGGFVQPSLGAHFEGHSKRQVARSVLSQNGG